MSALAFTEFSSIHCLKSRTPKDSGERARETASRLFPTLTMTTWMDVTTTTGTMRRGSLGTC